MTIITLRKKDIISNKSLENGPKIKFLPVIAR